MTLEEILKTTVESGLMVGIRFLSYDQKTNEWYVEDLRLDADNNEVFRGPSLQQAAVALLRETKAR